MFRIIFPIAVFFAVALLITLAVIATETWKADRGWAWLALTGAGVIALALVLSVHFANARDLDGRYADSPLKPWFDHLASGKGLCCSMADGEMVADVDWETKDGHYRVRLEDRWIEVPDDAVITEPNRAGRTMVWPMHYDGEISIRCFMPGSMT